MTLMEYRDKYLNDGVFEEPTKELAEAWLDAKIEIWDQLAKICREQDYPLVWGSLIDGDYENAVEVGCMSNYSGCYMIYSGIEKLAKLINAELTEESREDKNYPWEYSFEYKGHRIYQINERRLK